MSRSFILDRWLSRACVCVCFFLFFMRSLSVSLSLSMLSFHVFAWIHPIPQITLNTNTFTYAHIKTSRRRLALESFSSVHIPSINLRSLSSASSHGSSCLRSLDIFSLESSEKTLLSQVILYLGMSSKFYPISQSKSFGAPRYVFFFTFFFSAGPMSARWRTGSIHTLWRPLSSQCSDAG